MADVQEKALMWVNAYRAYFLDRAGGLPIVGQTDAGLEALGEACRNAMLRDAPLTDEEAAALAPNAPAGADI